MKRLRWTLFAAALLPFQISTQSVRAQVSATYLANEGFLLDGGGRKVLIDALFGSGLEGYPAPPPDLRSKLETAQPPFDDVDLVLATHYHGDHFEAQAVARHLRANREARFVSTPQAADQARALLRDDPQALERVEGIHPQEGVIESLTRGGVELKVLNLHHGRNRRPPVQNLGFLISLGGLEILHIGDTEATAEDLRPYDLKSRRIDLALLPVWYLTYEEWIEAMRREIQPARIGVMHLAEPDAPASYFGPEGSYAERVRKLHADFPEAQVFVEPGVRVEYP